MCKVENECLKSNNDSFIGCRGIDIFVTLIALQINEIVTLTFFHDIHVEFAEMAYKHISDKL